MAYVLSGSIKLYSPSVFAAYPHDVAAEKLTSGTRFPKDCALSAFAQHCAEGIRAGPKAPLCAHSACTASALLHSSHPLRPLHRALMSLERFALLWRHVHMPRSSKDSQQGVLNFGLQSLHASMSVAIA